MNILQIELMLLKPRLLVGKHFEENYQDQITI